MEDPQGFLEGLAARLQGPMHFRLFLQPLIAITFAIRDGRKDAREGRAPFFWTMFTDRQGRREMLRTGCRSVGKVFVVAIVLDLVFQYIAFAQFRPVGALMAGVVLALLPYIVLRGPAHRLFRRRAKSGEE